VPIYIDKTRYLREGLKRKYIIYLVEINIFLHKVFVQFSCQLYYYTVGIYIYVKNVDDLLTNLIYDLGVCAKYIITSKHNFMM